MDKESEKLIKNQLKDPEAFKKFKRMVSETKAYETPKSFTGELRPYQKIGYSWLVQNIKYNFGCILADDMGLGKTVQILTAILHFKELNPLDTEPSLIIVPPTLISNWENEIKKFTPSLSYYIYHGSNRTFPFEDYDIMLTSYGVIRLDLDMFADKKWFICVIDEAQNIKNPNTQQTKAIKGVPAYNKIALTGTPIENKLTDYWSIFDFVNKGYLSTLDNFKANYVMRIERLEETKTLDKFKTITKPFVLRRLKTDDNIKDELPDKIVNDIYCSLTKKQILLYNAIMDGIFEELEGKTGIERRGIILNIITGLKQACNHPAQYLRSDNPKISESGKMELLITILENILDVDEKVIIFTQYAQMGKIIQKLVSEKLKTDVLFLHGSLTQQKRNEVIENFQENKDSKILVATLKTGGVGLNLTAAQNVIHYDLWWNPAIENQATDRVHRIGQKSDVMVYRFITKGTLEEVIDEMSKSKIDLANKAISSDETFITEMSNEELKEKLSLRL
ncbi:DEAD/DEAH box helicase [uncultured Methanobrevibacter sp.]|uniref:DEAD/DEAH box helicase n=1 Tax=uncultured Methanobrevibacter sp. TaxID=253161 RepID=UPI00262CC34C|nr:DEAD/DEAH box helicase [uncultured Methanobrevibacter sp.]